MLNWGMRSARPRTRTDYLRLSAAGQLTLAIPLDDGPQAPALTVRPWEAGRGRTLARRCTHPAGDWRCYWRPAAGQDRCLLHAD